MNQSKISVRYAKAFFELMLEKKKLDAVLPDIHLVNNTITASDDLQKLLQNPLIKASKKNQVFDALFSKKVAKETLQFTSLIVTKGRDNLMQDIFRNFLDLHRTHCGITQVTLSTAQEISKKQTEELTQILAKKYTTNIELQEIIDESLIGGFILRINDLQYDASVKTKILDIKKELLS